MAPPPGIPPLGPHDPRTIGPFRLLGRLGAGGMGTVFAALTPQDQPAAVKVVHRELTEDADFRARFAREVALVRRAQSPCIPRFFDADTEAARPWLATEYVAGPTLRAHVRTHGPLQGPALRAFAAGVAEALQALHALGIVHRDLKPGNVILAPTGPKVLDFGIARALEETAITSTGALFGTPGWIAPELYAGAPPAPAADVFAWGGLIAFAATGNAPFGSGPPDVLAYRVMSEPPETGGLPGALAPLVSAALDKAPERRPTALQALEGVLGSPPSAAPEPTLTALTATLAEDWRPLPDHTTADTSRWPSYAPAGAPAPRRKRRLLVSAAAVSALVLAVAGGWIVGERSGMLERSPGTASEQEAADGTDGGQAGPPDVPGPTASDVGHGGPGLVGEVPEPDRDITFAAAHQEPGVFTVRAVEGAEDGLFQNDAILASITLDSAEATGAGIRFTGTVTFAADAGSYTVHGSDFRLMWPRDLEGSPESDPDADVHLFSGSYDEYPAAEDEPLAVVTADAPQAEFSFTVPEAPPVGEIHYSIAGMDFWGFTPDPDIPSALCYTDDGSSWGLTHLHGGYMCDATAVPGSPDHAGPDRDPADSHTWAEPEDSQ
ncbi:protein kinase domain-containing protein [Nocardiopsis baichengensis]